MKITVIKTCVLFALLLFTSIQPLSASAPFDGAWWNSVSRDQRIAFIDGYLDCLVADVGNTKSRINCSSSIMEPIITGYYKSKPSELKSDVMIIFFKLCSQEPITIEPSEGETYSGKHGILDGNFWDQMGADGELGFIQGYLECHKKYNKPTVIFEKSAEWYAIQISQWYGLDPNNHDYVNSELFIIKKRYMEAIANVLYAINKSGSASSAVVSSMIKSKSKINNKNNKKNTKNNKVL